MKKILSAILFVGALTACTNEMDEIFDQSAAERLNNTQAKYSALLTSSQYGWAFEYYPTSSADDGAVLYALKFDKDGSVDIAGDPFNEGVVTNEVSCWDIIADNGPTLSFSTYNTLIHSFADPGDDGSGYEGDYEFSFVYSATENPDSVIMLKGKKRGLYCRLKMIDEDVTPAEYLNGIATFLKTTFPESAPNYLLVHLGDSLVRMDDIATTTPKVYPFGKDAILFSKTNSFITTKYNGVYTLRFNRPFETADGEKAYNFIYHPDTQIMTAEGNPEIYIAGPDPSLFLYDRIVAGATVSLATSSQASDDLKAELTSINKAFSAVKYTFNNIQIKKMEDGVRACVNYRNSKKQNVTTYFMLEMLPEISGEITFKYTGPYNTASETLLKSIPAIETFLKALEGTYTVEHTTSRLDLSEVKFVSGDKYFVTKPVYPKTDDNNIQ